MMHIEDVQWTSALAFSKSRFICVEIKVKSEQWPEIYRYPTGHLEINVDKMLNVCLFLLFSRTNWIKAVQMCSKAREFALALAILECAIKPVAMLPVWKDSLGHTRYTQGASYTVCTYTTPTQINKITLVCSIHIFSLNATHSDTFKKA